MIKVVIIEDENAARSKLYRFIERLDEDIEVIAELVDVKGVQVFFKDAPTIDLIISDIELRDGNIFSFLENAQITCPIIFTTAYNQFWANAFESMGIEYLLKPYKFTRFQKAWEKFKKVTLSQTPPTDILKTLESLLEKQKPVYNYRERFAYKKGNGTAFIEVQEVTLISAEQGAIFLFDSKGNRLLCSENGLQNILDSLDESLFFYINRSSIVQKKYIEQIERFSKNVVAMKVTGITEWLKTSQSKASEFNEWVRM